MRRPSHHPSEYETFFEGPNPSLEFPDVGVRPEDTVNLSKTSSGLKARGFQWSCRFCLYHRVFGKITSFWAHLAAEHDEVPRPEILHEVTRSAKMNQAWADDRFYNYERNNPVTWQKIQQAQAATFDWEVFTGWKLPRTKLYKGRNPIAMSGSSVEEGAGQAGQAGQAESPVR